MNRQQYTQMQIDLVENGEVGGLQANDKIVGFIHAESGETWESYRDTQKQFVSENLITRQKANNRLHGFQDYIRLYRKEQA